MRITDKFREHTCFEWDWQTHETVICAFLEWLLICLTCLTSGLRLTKRQAVLGSLNFKLSHALSQKLLVLFSNEQNRKEQRASIYITPSYSFSYVFCIMKQGQTAFLFHQSFWFHVSHVSMRSGKICNIIS